MLTIEHLSEHKEYIEEVIQLVCKEFGYDDNYSFWESIVNHSLDKHKIPVTFVAIKDNKFAGTISLWRGDLLSRQDLFPWLSALAVKKEFRNQNIGQELQNYLINYAKDKGYEELFLYTDLNNYYEKTGWIHFDDGVEFTGGSMKLYKKVLKD